MTYIIDTLLAKYQDKVFQKEIRIPNYGLIKTFKEQTPQLPYLTPALADHIKKLESRTTELPAFKEQTIITSSSESYIIPSNLSESAVQSISLVTIFAGFRQYPELFVNNLASKEADFMKRLEEVSKAMALRLEQYQDSHLDTNKSQVWNGTTQAGYTFNAGTDTLEVTLAQQKDRMWDFIKTMAAQNNWSEDMLTMAATYGVNYTLSEYAKYKTFNEKDLITQDIPEINNSNRVSLTSGKRWTGYLLEPGAVGLLPNYTLPFRESKNIKGSQFGISSMELPGLGYQVGTYVNEEKVDASGIASGINSDAKMSWYEEYGFIFKFALLNRYNSDPTSRVSHVLKIDGNLA